MIQQILETLLLDSHELYGKVCKVDSVTGMSCDCTPIDGDAPINDVRLTAEFDADNKWVLVPKVGSFVIVGFLNKDVGYLVMVSEVSKVYLKAGTVVMDIDEAGFGFAKGTESLKAIVDDLIEQIKLIVVPTNVGPSGNPLNAAAFEAIKTRADNLLK